MRESARSGNLIVAEVLTLLTQLDPYGLDPGGTAGPPRDEYEPEATPMASTLINTGSIDPAQVDAVWLKWFGEPLSVIVGIERMESFVTDLNGLSGRQRT